jgi:hypothetical protein
MPRDIVLILPFVSAASLDREKTVKNEKLNLSELRVQSFVTQTNDVKAGAANRQLEAVLGETLDERPCTFPSMEPEGCR